MPTVTVRLFAAHREAAGRGVVEVDLEAGATVADLRRELLRAFPALDALRAATVVAVDGEFCGDAAPVRAGARVAVFPPVAGG
jgi:molybdopterin synthase catalytic subunit